MWKPFDAYERASWTWMGLTGKAIFAIIAGLILLTLAGVSVYEWF